MLLAAGLGLLVGLVMAFTGAGGAILAVPLLMFALQWDVAEAAPVALVAVCSAATVGTVMGLRLGIVRYRAALLMAVVGGLIAPLGVALAHRLPERPLALLFATVLLFVAIRLFREALLELRGVSPLDLTRDDPACKLNPDTGRFRWNAPCTRTLLQTGVLAGFLSGLLGVGGGFVIVPTLKRVSDLAMTSVVATALMVVAVVSASAVASTAIGGRLDLAAALPFAFGAVAAMLAARPLASRLAGPHLQMGFAVLAALVAVGLALQTLL